MRVQILTHRHRHTVTQANIFLHRVAPQIDVAILQPCFLIDVIVVDHERWRQCCVQHFNFCRKHFDLAAFQVGVDGAGRSWAHNACDLQHEFAAGLVCRLKCVGGVGIDHHLHQTFAITQVDENHAAVVATPMRPAEQGDLLSEVLFVDEAAVVCSHDGFQKIGLAMLSVLSFRARFWARNLLLFFIAA